VVSSLLTLSPPPLPSPSPPLFLLLNKGLTWLGKSSSKADSSACADALWPPPVSLMRISTFFLPPLPGLALTPPALGLSPAAVATTSLLSGGVVPGGSALRGPPMRWRDESSMLPARPVSDPVDRRLCPTCESPRPCPAPLLSAPKKRPPSPWLLLAEHTSDLCLPPCPKKDCWGRPTAGRAYLEPLWEGMSRLG
jgi:hypothetical protein